MPLYEDAIIGKDADGCFNEEYCKWCYSKGEFVYDSMQNLMDFLVPTMATHYHLEEADVQAWLDESLPKLNHWH
jgi:hypothetical protein